MRQELCNADEGRYLVTTSTGSKYEVDLTARTVRRHMAATPPVVDFLEARYSQLSRDGETVELTMLETCALSACAHYWLQVTGDHISTLRTTSPVMRIEPVTSDA